MRKGRCRMKASGDRSRSYFLSTPSLPQAGHLTWTGRRVSVTANGLLHAGQEIIFGPAPEGAARAAGEGVMGITGAAEGRWGAAGAGGAFGKATGATGTGAAGAVGFFAPIVPSFPQCGHRICWGPSTLSIWKAFLQRGHAIVFFGTGAGSGAETGVAGASGIAGSAGPRPMAISWSYGDNGTAGAGGGAGWAWGIAGLAVAVTSLVWRG